MLGVIADDFTGASDIASFLVENGLSTVQMNGVPTQPVQDKVEAIVISLKSRSNPVKEAIEQSLAAYRWLKANGCTQFYFKYCSTFDSTAKGNIGPVTDALMAELNTDFTVVTPALPINGRTIFNGYLFVGDVLLSESGMRNHPITPMTDANLVRLMDSQSKGKTGLVAYADVIKGAENVKTRFTELKAQGCSYTVVDAADNSQLAVLAEAVGDFKLVTGGSGLGAYMAERLSGGKKGTQAFTPTKGKTVVLSGSCSVMTNTQVNYYKAKASHLKLDVTQAINNANYADELFQWVTAHLDEPLAPMVYATVPADELKQIQTEFGVEKASHSIENTFAQLAAKLKQAGVTNFINAGGETSSIVVQQLGFTGFHIGKQIVPGVPWLKAINDEDNVAKPIYLALKSGNFGKEDFFEYAQGMFV
ncbi:four-carbon acid sugar kinase family protein [Haemophilus influenzae]